MLPIDTLLKLRHMTAEQVDEWKAARPGLTAEDYEMIAKISSAAPVAVPVAISTASLWTSTAWLLGASYSLLGADSGVARQTIMSRVDKVLPVTIRGHLRLGRTLSLEAYAEYKATFFAHITDLSTKSPLECAQWLADHTESDT